MFGRCVELAGTFSSDSGHQGMFISESNMGAETNSCLPDKREKKHFRTRSLYVNSPGGKGECCIILEFQTVLYGFSIVCKGTVAMPGGVSRGQIIKAFLAPLERLLLFLRAKGN